MPGSTRGGPRPLQLLVKLAATLALAVAVVAMVSLTAAPTARAQQQDATDDAERDLAADGLEVSASTVYVPDPANEQIDVTATYVMTNVQPDEVIDGSVRSFYFTKWVIAIPENVTDFSALSDGTELATLIEPAPDTVNIAFASIDLPFNLNYEQTVTVDVSYTIPGGAPRAESAGARVNDSFLSFSVWTSGDPDMTDVRVDIPTGFSMDLQGDLHELVEVTEAGETFLQATDIDDPRDFFGQVFGRNDTGLITEWAELPGAQATVRAWPDDPEWASFVVDAIEKDVPVIEDLTGLEWPAGNIEVIETVTPYLYGYGGWFNASSGLIEIGESLERDLILHELAHAWFNDTLVEGRWITEGLAEEFAARAIEATLAERPSEVPTEPLLPNLDDPLRVPLAEWASPWSLNEEDAFAYEQLHYNASWWVIRQITDEIGLESFSEVLVALRDDEMAYLGEGPIEQTPAPDRWTHFFDLLDIRAGATGLDELFATYVLGPDDVSRLADRRSAVESYHDLVAKAGSWSAPLIIRRQLSEWDFGVAQAHIADAAEIVQLRDDIAMRVDALELTIDDQSELPFETAMSTADLDSVRTVLLGTRRSLIDLQQNRAQLEQDAAALKTTVGFGPMTLADAQANEQETRAGIVALRRGRSDVEIRADDLGLVPPPWPTSAEPTDFVAAAALAQARLATLDAIEAATSASKSNRTLIQRIGLLGTDVEALLTESRVAFEADELDDALTAAAETESLLAQAAATGRRRLIWGAVATFFVMVAIAVPVWRRRSLSR